MREAVLFARSSIELVIGEDDDTEDMELDLDETKLDFNDVGTTEMEFDLEDSGVEVKDEVSLEDDDATTDIELDLFDTDWDKPRVGVNSEFLLNDPVLWILFLQEALYCCLTDALLAAAESTRELDLWTLKNIYIKCAIKCLFSDLPCTCATIYSRTCATCKVKF